VVLLLLPQVVPIAIKAAFLNCGQNCASGERFIVHRKIYNKFCARVTEVAKSMRQGPTLGAGGCFAIGFLDACVA
jgi:acyl-CoA reductase-like NAD-dependent aldehyde dehydrogenase